MQFSHALIALVAAGLANAQLPNIPTCSLNCFINALGSDGCSSLTDFACHCSKPSLVGQVTPCVQQACSEADQSSVSSIVVSECSAAGHPISVPAVGGTSSSSSSSASSTETQTQTQTETETETTTSTSEVSSSSSVATPTEVSSTPVETTSTSTVVTSTETTLASTGLASATSTGPPLFTNAAQNVKGNMGGVAAIAAAAAYLL